MKKTAYYTTTLLIAVIFSACTRPAIDIYTDQDTYARQALVTFHITKSAGAEVVMNYGDGNFENLGGLNEKFLKAEYRYSKVGVYQPYATAYLKDKSTTVYMTVKIE